jgi:hypothetical protein
MVESDVSALVYAGNASTVLGYPVTFPFLDPVHVLVSIKPEGGAVTVLGSGQFTVHLAEPGAPFVTTVEPYPATTEVTVFRSLPFTQPTEYPEQGPFLAETHERALDRLCMQIQQLWRAVTGGQGGTIIVPGGGTGFQDVLSWANETARLVTAAKRPGQLGVQLDDLSIWVSSSTSAGDWVLRVTGSQTVAAASTLVIGYVADGGDHTNALQSAAADLLGIWGPDAVIFAGDNNYNDAAGYAQDWANFDEYVTAQKAWPALGNHDIDTVGWASLHAGKFPYLPGNKRYYSKVLGNGLLELFVIHSGRDSAWNLLEPDGNAIGSIQHQWFVAALAASTAIWKVVVFHHPPATSRTGANEVETALDWPEFAKVDLIICGHAHLNEMIAWRGRLLSNMSGLVRLDGTTVLKLQGGLRADDRLLWADDVTAMIGRLLVTRDTLTVEAWDVATNRLLYTREVQDLGLPVDVWQKEVWTFQEELIAAAQRSAGTLPRGMRLDSGVRLDFDTPGLAGAQVQIHINGNPLFDSAPLLASAKNLLPVSWVNPNHQVIKAGADIDVQIIAAPGYDPTLWKGLEIAFLGNYLT